MAHPGGRKRAWPLAGAVLGLRDGLGGVACGAQGDCACSLGRPQTSRGRLAPRHCSAEGGHVCFRAQLPGPHPRVPSAAVCPFGQVTSPSCGLHFPIFKHGMVTVLRSLDYCGSFHKRQSVQWLRLWPLEPNYPGSNPLPRCYSLGASVYSAITWGFCQQISLNSLWGAEAAEGPPVMFPHESLPRQ